MYKLEGLGSKAPTWGISTEAEEKVDPENRRALDHWEAMLAEYSGTEFIYHVRGREIRVPLHEETLSHTRVPKVACPATGHGEIGFAGCQENVPGEFPYTAGVFPFKRAEEDPARMFAGEGRGADESSFPLSGRRNAGKAAVDRVRLRDPLWRGPPRATRHLRQGGQLGVSIATLDDAKKLYSGFDLRSHDVGFDDDQRAAPMILAFYMNAAIDQACEKHISDNDLWAEVEARIDAIYGDRPRPVYAGDLPKATTGWGSGRSG